jgi:predicted DNA-binding transcriptional regulator AlpA
MIDNPFFAPFFEGVRPARRRERAALTIFRALEIRKADHMPVGGGGSETSVPRTPRRSASTAKAKKSDGGDDGDGPAPRRVQPLFYDLNDVADALALSTRGVQRMVQAGEFPKPRELSARRVAWLAREVEEWAESRPEAAMLPPVNAGMHNGAAA